MSANIGDDAQPAAAEPSRHATHPRARWLPHTLLLTISAIAASTAARYGYASELRVVVYTLLSIAIGGLIAQLLHTRSANINGKNVLRIPLLTLAIGVSGLLLANVAEQTTAARGIWVGAIAVCATGIGWIFASVNRDR